MSKRERKSLILGAALLALCLVTLLIVCGSGPEQPYTTPQDNQNTPEVTEQTPTDELQLLMVDGVLYYNTGELSAAELRCGTLDGHINYVPIGTMPQKDGEGNIQNAKGYQIGFLPGSIDVLTEDDKWIVFKPLVGGSVNEEIIFTVYLSYFEEGGIRLSAEDSCRIMGYLSNGERSEGPFPTVIGDFSFSLNDGKKYWYYTDDGIFRDGENNLTIKIADSDMQDLNSLLFDLFSRSYNA